MESFKERLRRSGKTYIVGVAGDSGSGKTTFVQGIKKILGKDIVSSFSLDDYHTLDRRQRKEKGITPLNPEANDLSRLASDLKKLREGESIQKPVYDHSDGTFKKPEPFKPTPVVIVEGLHPFYTPELRKHSDFKLFVDPDRGVKKEWKLKRDVEKRGHRKEDVLAEMRERAPDYEKYIDQQKIYAEVIVQVQESQVADEEDIYAIQLIQRVLDVPLDEVDLAIDLSALLRLSKKNFSLEYRRDEYYGYDVGVLALDGMIHRDVAEKLEARICAYTGKKECALFDPKKEYLTTRDLAQLIVCWRFIEKICYLMKRQQ